VDSFKYLGTMVNKMNNWSVEVNARLTMAYWAYYGLQNNMKSRIISRNTKTLLYKTLIRPVLTYGAETWVLKVKLKVKVALRGFSTCRPLGSIIFLPQQVPAFISRGATHLTDVRELYQQRRELFPLILLADL
jgi:hypothetical protein